MKYALILGNDSYTDPKLAQLKTPAADSRALANVLGDENIGGFDEVIPLINQTETEIRRAISSFLEGKRLDDLVLVYFSGHGVLDSNGRLYLASKDTQTSILRATAIPSAFISDEMDNCRSRRQILILDCCNSGAFARGTKAGEQKAVTASTFEGSGYGRVVLTASDSTQYALEGDQVIKQTELSLFTHFLLEGLQTGKADTDNDGYVSLDEWYDYTYTNVLATTPAQIPHKWSYRQRGDLLIAKNPHYELIQRESAEKIAREEAERLRQEKEKREREILELEQTIRERLEREIAERVSQEREEQETVEKIAQEKATHEKTTWEKSELDAIEKAEQVSTAKVALEKEYQQKREKILDNAIRKLRWEKFLNSVRYRFLLIRLYFIPIFLGLTALALLVYAYYFMPENPILQSPTTASSQTFISQPSLTSTDFFIPTEATIPSSALTEAFTPTVISLPTEITDAKGVSMVLVSEGEFMMGSESGDENERPVHQVYLDAFYMDIYEVTNVLYKACAEAGECQPPKDTSAYGDPTYENHPVVYVDWNQAQTYCEWRDASLPTEAQWEKAARGLDGRTYPWGEDITCDHANYGSLDNGCVGDTTEVGSYESGKSPYGIYDLAGNVWEWAADWYHESYYSGSPYSNPLGPNSGQYGVLRGGALNYFDNSIRSAVRLNLTRVTVNQAIGFRCAKDANS